MEYSIFLLKKLHVYIKKTISTQASARLHRVANPLLQSIKK
jgi:hypothetical protein